MHASNPPDHPIDCPDPAVGDGPALALRAAAMLCRGQHHPTGTLYVVATPIGNLADISLRAWHVLALADAVACEDTRVGGGLLRHLGLPRKTLVALHQHNEAAATQGVLERLTRGERVALISDAGTPAIADPGARLVAAAQAAGHRTLPLPGPSSVVTALSIAGDTGVAAHADDDAPHGHVFHGFAPAKGSRRERFFEALATEPRSQVLFEAPHRIEDAAARLGAALGARPLTLARELSKQFETVHTTPAGALAGWLAQDAAHRRGEFVIVVHASARGAGAAQGLPTAVLDLLRALLKAVPVRQAAQLVAAATGAPRNAVYDAALRSRAATADEADGPDSMGTVA